MSGKYPQYGQTVGANTAAVIIEADTLAPGLPWDIHTRAYPEGREIGVNNYWWTSNPHESGTAAYTAWAAGFTHGVNSRAAAAYNDSMFNTGIPDRAEAP
jgi:hypothetical protein|tara:strand:- start:3469 stop:3768 length:300 start_codon:yes stop_codon:yes gene_type:complete